MRTSSLRLPAPGDRHRFVLGVVYAITSHVSVRGAAQAAAWRAPAAGQPAAGHPGGRRRTAGSGPGLRRRPSAAVRPARPNPFLAIPGLLILYAVVAWVRAAGREWDEVERGAARRRGRALRRMTEPTASRHRHGRRGRLPRWYTARCCPCSCSPSGRYVLISSGRRDHARVGEAAPAFTLSDLDGNPVSLADLADARWSSTSGPAGVATARRSSRSWRPPPPPIGTPGWRWSGSCSAMGPSRRATSWRASARPGRPPWIRETPSPRNSASSGRRTPSSSTATGW